MPRRRAVLILLAAAAAALMAAAGWSAAEIPHTATLAAVRDPLAPTLTLEDIVGACS